MTGSYPVRGSIRVLALVAAILLSGVAAGGVLTRSAAAADEPGAMRPLAESNTALLARAAHGAARKLVAQLPITPGTKVGLRAEGEGGLDADMREALLQALNERRIHCVLLPAIPALDDSSAAAAPRRPTGPGGGAGSDVSPGSGSTESLADLNRRAQEAQAYEALQAERQEQAARADSLARLSGNGDDDGRGADGGAVASVPATTGNLPVLTWRVQEARVDYVRMFRGGLFGSQRVERRARVDLALRLTPAGSDAIAWSASADSMVGDVVFRSELGALEDRTRPESRPQLPSASFKKVLEPALVVVLIAGLVSLFYQNRP